MTDRLYHLLPAIYRLRDTVEGEPLRALLAVIAAELLEVEANITGLYDNWFIETCDEWVVPYIGDLLDVRGLHAISGTSYTQRAWVANTIRYRRRKGTAAVLEQLARDVTGWPARVVEFFQLLATTQYLNHLRPQNLVTPDLRNLNQLELLESPFDTIAHTADVRPISQFEGKYNIPNIGLFLWRLQSYHVTENDARAVNLANLGCYTFNPLGIDAPLFTKLETETEITHLAEEINVPTPIRPGAFYLDLKSYQELYGGAIPAHQPTNSTYYGRDRSFYIIQDGTPIPPINVVCKNLSAWDRPPNGKVAVDVRLGRLAFADGVNPAQVLVNYTYGFSGDVGGGTYNRQDTLKQAGVRRITWQVGVAKTITPVGTEVIFDTLTQAIQAWNTQPNGTIGAIAILDNRTYSENLTGIEIQIPPGSQLLIVAADWIKEDVPGFPGQKQRREGKLQLDELRPHIQADLFVRGNIPGDSKALGELILNGLLIEGKLTVLDGNLSRLRLDHSTLLPAKGGLEVQTVNASGKRNDELNIQINRSICGTLNLADTVPKVQISETIINSSNANQAIIDIGNIGTAVEIQASTIFGTCTTLGSLEASNSIFTAPVIVSNCQIGCVRFCYVPEGSRVPRRYRCQPQLVLQKAAQESQLDSADALSPAERNLILARVRPEFTSEYYGQPSYAQLSFGCAVEIRTGAEDGSEMGVFSYLQQPQRETNLRVSLNEYLRFGLAAGIIYVT
ncbi:hypothetical protein A6770_22160 [Nostoc minutum NIES-26]|uniref:Uncharacterized protein n=1 Tax=Nostoc minutum NIES-26 TaxID=1844469 RepID=A0A367QYZ3_9NOSO|nr:hypothetical protein A6770_22160 [Nostoc minutum NIES-26]